MVELVGAGACGGFPLYGSGQEAEMLGWNQEASITFKAILVARFHQAGCDD